MRSERVAELHRPEPVEFEEAVEVTSSADPGEPRWAVALILCKGNVVLFFKISFLIPEPHLVLFYSFEDMPFLFVKRAIVYAIKVI